MTERKPAGLSFESWIDRQIREAEERGEFDDLPGTGKPLPDLGKSHDEMWWIRQKLEREGLSTEAVLPPGVRLRKQIDGLPDTVRKMRTEEQVRQAVAELNEQVKDYWRNPSGPQLAIAMVDADPVVQRWRADRAAAEAATQKAVEEPHVEQGDQRQPWWRRVFRR
ncbi:DUF1992 domain-containing protein [Phytoactinopolyspora limicola]|uniref:DnaJ family domain-containing protein n=1 Tax=Phytoactinopolyspora limicola TaxID=2715536 RepID=UPI001408B920|nr:DUF1992 domain-containing protein [Phytoactinopolyspora limicola]